MKFVKKVTDQKKAAVTIKDFVPKNVSMKHLKAMVILILKMRGLTLMVMSSSQEKEEFGQSIDG